MQYYRITTYTPIVGQEKDFYISTEDPYQALYYGDECTFINGINHYNSSGSWAEHEFIAACGFILEKIKKEEFNDYNV